MFSQWNLHFLVHWRSVFLTLRKTTFSNVCVTSVSSPVLYQWEHLFVFFVLQAAVVCPNVMGWRSAMHFNRGISGVLAFSLSEHNKPSPSESMSRSGFWRYSHRSRSHCSDEAPTPGEVRHSICKLRNRCAVGSDGILPELLKYTEEPGSISLQSLCVLQLSY